MGYSQAAMTNDPELAYTEAREQVARTASLHGWTDEELATALSDVQDAEDATEPSVMDYASQGFWSVLAPSFASTMTSTDGMTNEEYRVSQFWGLLYAMSSEWTGKNADKLRATFLQSQQVAKTTAEETIGTPVEATQTLLIDPTIETASDVSAGLQSAAQTVTTVGRSRWFLPVVGLVAVAFIVRSLR